MAGAHSSKKLKQYGLSSDDDDVVEHSLGANCSPVSSLSHRSGSKKYSRSSERYLLKQEPMRSKYDNRPRNVVLGEDGFSPLSRRLEGARSESNHNRNISSGIFDDIHLGEEFEDGVGGQIDEFEARADMDSFWVLFLRWLGKMEWWKVLVFGCVMGVVFGALYRGGGLYIGLSSKGECVCVCIF